MITIREFLEKDIDNKIKWVNDPENNKYLHYELPLELEKTKRWFKTKNNKNRYDAVIEYDAVAIGLIGILNINDKVGEYYILMGEKKFKNKGIAKVASQLIIEYGNRILKLNRLIGYTEINNQNMKNLFFSLNFKEKRILKEYAINRGRKVDVYFYEYTY